MNKVKGIALGLVLVLGIVGLAAQFAEVTDTGLPGMVASSVTWGDYDNDGDLGFLTTGYTITGGGNPVCAYHTKLYLNYSSTPNLEPASPSNLRAEIVGEYVEFQWDAAVDDHTPTFGLNYALRIGTTPGGNDICSPMAAGCV